MISRMIIGASEVLLLVLGVGALPLAGTVAQQA
jgi:hypothetical protein